MTRGFRFGVNMTVDEDRIAWVDKCRQAEALGYDMIHVPDHLGLPAPFPSLVLAAEATESTRVGTFVLNASFYNPVLLARDVFALQAYTDNRFELGVGAGYVKAEFDQAGIPWPTAGQRIGNLERTVEHIQAEAKTPLPLLVGGNGDRVLRLAATRADVVGFSGLRSDPVSGALSIIPAEAIDERVAYVRQQAGDRDYESNFLIQLVAITSDRRATAEALHEQYKPPFPVEDVLAWPGFLFGEPKEIAEQVREHRDRFGFTYLTVLEPAMADFAKVIEHLK
ncbi:TIGR03621 family F420-dependent LLM class oxidoreductase [Kibdelosporangium lantanae]